MDLPRLTDQLIKHEGMVLYAYPDSLGFLTIGAGRLIDQRRGGGISRQEAIYLLQNDIEKARIQCERYAWYQGLDPVRQNAICELMFALGPLNLEHFVNMIDALTHHDYTRAAGELLDSHWAAQVGHVRASTLASMLATGRWP